MKKSFALFALLALVACANKDKVDPPKVEEAPEPPKAAIKTDNLICPQVAILQQVQESFDYGREKAEASQLVAKARMTKISGDCAYRAEAKVPGVDIAFKMHAISARGPRLGGDMASFPYFIAVVDPSDRVLSRQVLTAQFKFSGEKKLAEIDEPLHVFIPLADKALLSGPDYRVLVGFIKTAGR